MPDRDNPAMPWDDVSYFREKPEGVEFGFVTPQRSRKEPGEFKRCDSEQLRAEVESANAVLVAVPEYDNLVPPSIVRSLWPAVQKRELEKKREKRNGALLNFFVFGGITLFALLSGYKVLQLQLVLLFFVFFGLIPLVLEGIRLAVERLKRDRGSGFEKLRQATLFGYWIGTRDAAATRRCVQVLVALFAVQVWVSVTPGQSIWSVITSSVFFVGSGSIEAAALVKDKVRDGELWRLLTAGLLHGGLLHIFFNGTAFANVGSVLEALYGKAVLLSCFTASVLVGSVASVLFLPHVTSVGASGGILGLVGFLFVAGIRFRHALPPGFANSIIRSVLLIAALGLVAWKFIDNAAHLGGFLTGCLFAIPLTHDLSSLGRYQPGAVVRSAGAVSAIALVAGAAFTAWKLLTIH